MLYEVFYDKANYATVVIRATTAAQAFRLAVDLGQKYLGDEMGGVSVEPIDPDGPSGVIIEDWS